MMHGQLFGKSFDHFLHIMHVMEKHGIDTPEQLEASIVQRPYSIEVYDSVNADRLLGVYLKPPKMMFEQEHRYYMVPVVGLASAGRFDPDEDIFASVKTIRFSKGWKNHNGYYKVAVLHTDAPLSLLMQHDAFRLPGEREPQFIERWLRRQ